MQHLSALLLALALMAGIFALQDSSTADAKDAAPAQMSDKDLAKCLEGKDGGAPAPQGLMGMSPLSGPGIFGTMDGGFPPFFGNPQGQPQMPPQQPQQPQQQRPQQDPYGQQQGPYGQQQGPYGQQQGPYGQQQGSYGQQQGPYGQQQPQQPWPQQPQTGGAGQLEGCWSATNGQNFVIMIFMNGFCALNLNGKQVYGPYAVQGQHLLVRFTNGQTFEADFAVQGSVLRFSTGLQLTRQQMPQQPQPQPQTQTGSTPLQGSWQATLPNGATIVFSFNGNQYFVTTNGQQTEAGTFVLNGSRLEFSVAFGQAAGQRGVNNWQLNGNVLVITGANGQGIQLTRQA
ncbi:MAG: hypothetical protein II515_03150 [Desulfovibrio sp.]|nr:hypothetical protein [Desulfovibrio sp.]